MSARRYLTLLQDANGYPHASQPRDTVLPSQPVLVSVVKEEDYEALRVALEDLLDRKNDYPTDMSGAMADHEWQRAFERARAALDGLEAP